MLSKRIKLFFVGMVVVLLMTAMAPVALAGQSYAQVVEDVDNYLQQAHSAYRQGNVAEAKSLVDEAYFGPYESGQMEKAVRLNISAKRNAEVESAFRKIKQEMTKGTSSSEIKQAMDKLVAGLREDAKNLDGNSSGAGVFISSFLIILREGFEAILIIGAIIAYLVKSGYKSKVKVIYQSTLVAILASLITAWILQAVLSIRGSSREVLEGVTMLIAVAVLFSVSYWLISKSEAKRWQNYIEGKVQGSLSRGNRMALWFAVFLAVYREGAETVLFYQAMMTGTTDLTMIIAGILAGTAALVVIFLIIRYGSIKLPMKPFFLGTSILLYYLAFVFVGQGVAELQAAGLISATQVNIPTIAWLGILPTWETLSPQLLLLLAAVFSFVHHNIKGKGNDKRTLQSSHCILLKNFKIK
ncbi:hypothetical protein JCM15765_43880 [Paradesulfitobacterium aromaticivorans]